MRPATVPAGQLGGNARSTVTCPYWALALRSDATLATLLTPDTPLSSISRTTRSIYEKQRCITDVFKWLSQLGELA